MSTPEMTTGEEAPSWEQLPAWLRESLASPALRYTHYLPIQKIVVPILDRALTSYLPMDVCLSAPTGSGKTLCYLLPMVNLIAKQKRELAETAVRGVVLVPTKALGAQVYHVAKAMTAGSPISVVSCCGDAQRRESGSLVKEVRLPFVNMSSSTLLSSASKPVNGEEEALEEEEYEVKNKNRIDDDNDDEGNENDLEALLRTAESVLKNQRPARNEKGRMTADAEDEEEEGASSNSLLYLARADIIIATPQRLLRHLGSTPGFTLKDLRMLVIDEADQLMTGAFTSFVSRIVRTFEESSSSLSSSSLGNRGEAMSERRVLHKVLCSATLSAHTARISDIRLRNCRYFSLDTDGSTRALVDANVTETATGDMSHVSSKFSLPPGLEERVLALSKDEARHGVLLKLVRHLDQKRTEERQREEANQPSEGNRGDDRLTVLPTTIGQSIVVFCATGEVVRVLTKFLCAAGLAAFEFTALSTELERRRAILAAVAGKPSILVTTDALMRGVDLPGVGYVVMYDAPRSLQQYVHRVGRTARALRRGSAYMILSKKGPSGTQSDGEVASFLALDRYLKRSQPVQYEYELKRLTDEEMEEANALLQATQRELQGMLRNTLQQRAVVVNAAPVNNNNGNGKGATATGGAAASSSATANKRPREGEEGPQNNNKSNNHNQHSNRNWGNPKKFPPTQGHQHRPPRQQQA